MNLDLQLERATGAIPEMAGPDLVVGQVLERLIGQPITSAISVGCHRLCLEQIRQAIADISNSSLPSRRWRENAREWVARGYVAWSISPDVTSFDGCCALLGIEAAPARAVLLAIPAPGRRRSHGPRRSAHVEPVVHRGMRVRLYPFERGRPPSVMAALVGGALSVAA